MANSVWRSWRFAGLALLLLFAVPPRGAAMPGLPDLDEQIDISTIDGLSLSPDGRWLAFRVIERSLAQNETWVQWYVVAVDGGRAPRGLGPVSAPIWLPLFDVVEKATPVWSPDSSALYVRLLDGSAIAIHRLGIDGSDRVMTDEAADVESFTLAPHGSRLLFTVRNTRADIAQAQAKEEREGIHLDKSVYTEGLRLTDNFRIGDRLTTVRGIDVTHNGEQGAGPLQSRSVLTGVAQSVPPVRKEPETIVPEENAGTVHNFASVGKVREVRVRAITPADPVLEVRSVAIEAQLRDGSLRSCDVFFCKGLSAEIRQVGLDPARGEIWVLYEKDFSGRTVLYGWNPVSGKARIIAQAGGSWDGGASYGTSPCAASAAALFCVLAAPSVPPRLVRIDLASGKSRLLVDPNVRLGTHDFGRVRFLAWRDKEGRPANGVLVLPGHANGPVPLVITTYRCRGFLRGGISWLAPEYGLAARGMAALCVNNVNSSQFERDAQGHAIPLAQHRAALASYAAIIDQLAHQGLIDPARVGIAGHSYSANVVGYAISHSDLFAAAVIGGGLTIDPASYVLTASAPDSWRKSAYPNMSLPLPGVNPGPLWNEISPALNANRIKAPLLMLPPESEYAATLQLYTGIVDAGGTVDEYVFPHEGHMANRAPVHSYWRALRALDWFAFWLGGTMPSRPDRDDQFAHWRALRAARGERQ